MPPLPALVPCTAAVVLNGKQVNTVQAIWAMSKADITEDMYTAFFKFKSGDYEAPLYRLHFSSDAPIALNALLFVGQTHEEKYGLGRIKPGVDLYSRKVRLREPPSHGLPKSRCRVCPPLPMRHAHPDPGFD